MSDVLDDLFCRELPLIEENVVRLRLLVREGPSLIPPPYEQDAPTNGRPWDTCSFARRLPDSEAHAAFAQTLSALQRIAFEKQLRAGSLSCGKTLLDPTASALPDHLCYDTQIESVDHFVQRRGIGLAIMPILPTQPNEPREYLWPLPLGAEALRAYAELLDSFAESNAKEREDLVLPWPLLDFPNAWVGLIVERYLEAGSVRLFGLVTPYVIPDEERGEWTRMTGRPSSGFLFNDAVIQTQYFTAKPLPEDDLSLVREARKLSKWYHAVVHGTHTNPGGRKPGPDFDDATLQSKRAAAIAELKREHDRITYRNVAARMGIGESTLRKYVRDGHLDALR